MSKHFALREIKCRHCDKCEMDDEFMDRIEFAREIADIPFHVNSGYRCPEYDTQIGGAGNHPTGKAMDIAVINGVTRARILFALHNAGFKRFGIDKYFIHVDCVSDRPSPCVWIY